MKSWALEAKVANSEANSQTLSSEANSQTLSRRQLLTWSAVVAYSLLPRHVKAGSLNIGNNVISVEKAIKNIPIKNTKTKNKIKNEAA